MEGISFLFLLLVFISGILFNVIWRSALGLGYGALLFKNSIADSLIMMAKNVKTVHEIQQLKYAHYQLLDRDEKYIQYQKMIDETEVKSIRNTVIRNYINSIPPRFNHLIDFDDWDSAMLYLKKILKERNGD